MPIRAPPGTPTGPTPDGGYVSPSGIQYSQAEWSAMRGTTDRGTLHYTGNVSEIRANPVIDPSPPASSLFSQPDPSPGVNRVLLSSSSYQDVKAQQDAAAQRDNLILGFIPNPLARYEAPVAKFLANTPMRKSLARQASQVQIGETWIDRTVPGRAFTSFYGGLAEDVQQRPIKFTLNVAGGYAIGSVFQLGSGALSSAASAGIISQRAATIIPKAAAGLAGGAFMAGSAISIASEPTVEAKGRRAGIITSEAAAMSIGGALSYRRSPLRWGFSTEQVEKPAVRVIDLTREIDVRPVVDLSTAKIVNPTVYEPPITRAERAMIIRQYHLTPEEIHLAKTNKLTLNDILNVRIRMERPEIPQIAIPEPARPVVLETSRLKSISKVIPQEVQQVRVRQMNGFVPDVFTSVITVPAVTAASLTTSHTSPVVLPSVKVTPVTVQTARQRTRDEQIITPVVISRIVTTPINAGASVTVTQTGTSTRSITRTIPGYSQSGKTVIQPVVIPALFLPGKSGGRGGGYLFSRGAMWKNPVPTIASFFGPLTTKRKRTKKRTKRRKK